MIIIIAGLVGGYIYHTNISSEIFINQPLNGRIDDLKDLANIDINFSSLEVSEINNLNILGEYPVNPGITGKRDIFAPF